jgi:hypothetical protein
MYVVVISGASIYQRKHTLTQDGVPLLFKSLQHAFRWLCEPSRTQECFTALGNGWRMKRATESQILRGTIAK